MVYFTSWDINVFLCLLTYLPEDVVKGMMKMTKKLHEEFSLEEAKRYWVSNSPTLVRLQGPTDKEVQLSVCLRRRGFKYYVPNDKDRGKTRISVYRARTQNMIEFRKEWRLRSIELRKAKVVEWCKFGEERDQMRHQHRLKNIRERRKRWEVPRVNCYSNDYTKNLWKSWEAGAASYYFVGQNRRNYISKWYDDIHPGRFFLFYRENKIIQERNRGVPKGPCEDGYRYPETPIFDKGPYEQLIEDLRCLDGPGIGEPVGKKVEHIDDLFH